ncbi:MAG: hypothetical protein JNK53_04780 [Phycisphaerae bacterium]|nr:hypothetical protein [Phycisphaerae bacterium]
MLTARSAVQTVRLGTRQFMAGIVVSAALVASSAATAQFGGRAHFGEAFQPDILQRDLPLMVESLQLEEWQRPILEAMLSDYTAGFHTGLEGLKDRMKAAAESAARSGAGGNGDAILEKVMEPWAAWRNEKRQMFEKFVSDLQSQLGPQQRELWPRFERALRRERQLHEGALSGESLDLWSLIAKMQLSPSEASAIAPALEAYEIALDTAIVTRMTRLEALEGELREAMQQMNYDTGADVQDRIMTLRIAVRATNDEAVETIASLLGERGAAFRKEALAAGYPDAFRKHPVLMLIDQALAIDTLTQEQRSQIEALRAELQVVSDEANMRYYEMLRVEEPKAPRRKVQQQMERKANNGKPTAPTPVAANLADPIIKMRVERDQLGEPYRERLMAILTPEQQPSVPGSGKLDAEVDRPKGSESKARPTAGQALMGSQGQAGGNDERRREQPRRDPRNPAGDGSK